MENRTSLVILLNILDVSRGTSWALFSVLCVCNLFITVLNSVIIITVVLSPELHKPMHMFLCNLAVVDIVGSLTIIPKQLQMLASGNNEISYLGCMAQSFFINLYIAGESLSLSFISTDRYLAICKPLRYHAIISLNRSMYIILLGWLATAVASTTLLTFLLNLQLKEGDSFSETFCLCYTISIINLAVSDTSQVKIFAFICIVVFFALPPLVMLFTFLRVCLEFVNRISPKLNKKSKETLVTQLLVTAIYFTSIVILVIRGRVKQSSSSVTDKNTFSYVLEMSIIVPAASNAVIYGLRVTALRKAIVNGFQKIFINRQIIVRSKKIDPRSHHGK